MFNSWDCFALAQNSLSKATSIAAAHATLHKSRRNFTSLIITYCQWLDLLLHLQKSIKIRENPIGKNSTSIPDTPDRDSSLGCGWGGAELSQQPGGWWEAINFVSLSKLLSSLKGLILPTPASFSCLKMELLNCKGLWFCPSVFFVGHCSALCYRCQVNNFP